MTVIDYVVEEVSRQGHDTASLDGIERVGWMLDAWAYALLRMEDGRAPTLMDVVLIGRMVEPLKNAGGLRKCNVRVGPRECPPFERVQALLRSLLGKRDKLNPLGFYKQFELVHPFADGNGRTGKILLNWLNATLLDPVFPPSDLFGHPIRNP